MKEAPERLLPAVASSVETGAILKLARLRGLTMDDDFYNQYRRKRESYLTIVLTGMTLLGGLFALSLLTGGFFLYVMAAVMVIAGVGFFHYLLWGRGFSNKTAGEQEEQQDVEKNGENGSPFDPHRPHHF